MVKEILVLGNQSSGKSLFITRLLSINDLRKISTIPTTGIELHNFHMRDIDYNLREVGGLMSSQWMSYIEYCDILLYMIDLSDLGSLATTIMLLYEILDCIQHNSSKSIPFAVVFNKNDICDPMSKIIYDNFINNEYEFLSNSYNKIVYFYGNSIDDTSILAVKDWMSKL